MQWLRTQTLEPSGLGLNLSFSTNYSCELGQATELFCAKECSNYRTIALISHARKVMLKILQAKLQQYVV